MDLMTLIVETDPSSFKEIIEQPIWVDVVVEEYKSIMKNSVFEVFPRVGDK